MVQIFYEKEMNIQVHLLSLHQEEELFKYSKLAINLKYLPTNKQAQNPLRLNVKNA